MAWRQQQKQRRRERPSASRGTDAVRASPWASQSVKRNDFLDTGDLRVQLADLTEQRKARSNQKREQKRRPKTQPGFHGVSPPLRPQHRRREIMSMDVDTTDGRRNLTRPRPSEEKEGGGLHEAESVVGGSSSSAPERRRQRRRGNVKPTHFVCVKVDDNSIKRNVRNIQAGILARAPDLEPFLIQESFLHLTLTLLHIDSPHEMKKVRSAMQAAAKKIAALLVGQPLQIEVAGIKTFGSGRVLVAGVSHGAELLKEARDLCHTSIDDAFSEDTQGGTYAKNHSIILEREKPLTAHVTIAKMPGADFRCRNEAGKAILDENVWSSAEVTRFGYQSCDRILLCPLGSRDPSKSFYTTECSGVFYLGEDSNAIKKSTRREQNRNDGDGMLGNILKEAISAKMNQRPARHRKAYSENVTSSSRSDTHRFRKR